MNPINQRIIDQMKKEGISAYRLSKLSNVMQQTIRNWKNGKSVPTKSTIEYIAPYLNCSAEYLISGENYE